MFTFEFIYNTIPFWPCIIPFLWILSRFAMEFKELVTEEHKLLRLTSGAEIAQAVQDRELSKIGAERYTSKRELAIEQSLWKRPPLRLSTPRRGLPSYTRYNEVSLGTTEASKLQRLPDEILLIIVSFLSSTTDRECLIAFFHLQQVSRRLRRLMQDRKFLHHPFSHKDCCQWCSGGHKDRHTLAEVPSKERHCFQHKVGATQSEGLGKLIRKNTTCERCQKHRDERERSAIDINCKFQALNPSRWLYCVDCRTTHPEICFPSARNTWPSCIGHQGSIRLCSHKTLSGRYIKVLVDRRINIEPIGGTGVFIAGCDHKDHKRPCSEGRRPQVYAMTLPSREIVLLIFWRGHSGSDPSVFHRSGYLRQEKVQDAIRKIRTQGGSYLVAQRGLNSMAEWDFIAEIDGSEVPSPGLIKLRGGWASINHQSSHAGNPFRLLNMTCGHCEKDKGCIVLTYLRRIRFKYPTPRGERLCHDWFHAIDPTSYTYSGHSGVPETCGETSCRNHYAEKVGEDHPILD